MFAVVGLSHHTAPIEVREQMALSREQLVSLLEQLVTHPEIAEAFVISTCNRVEVMACAASGVELAKLDQAVRSQLALHAAHLTPHLYSRLGNDALRHLFRVACSLDSLVVGEPQILGQMKQAFDLAQEVGTVGPALRRATTHAVRAAKRVRTETALGVGQVSVPSVAVDLTRRIFGDLKGHKAALLGLGEMGQLVAKQLGGEGASLIALGRNPERTAEVGRSLGATVRGLDQLEQTLVEVDVLVAMTSSQQVVVDYDTVARLRKQRRGRRLFFIDLSVPRNIDPRINELEDMFLYNVDDLSEIVKDSKSSRKGEADRAEQIVLDETKNYERAASAQQATPMVVALRRRFGAILRAEFERSQRGKLRDLTPEQTEAVGRMLDAAVNKMLHAPTTRLREVASNPGEAIQLETWLGALTELFELDSDDAMMSNGDSLAPRATKPPQRESRPAPAADADRGSHSPLGHAPLGHSPLPHAPLRPSPRGAQR
jgi:glutamyl-tRNA reductase